MKFNKLEECYKNDLNKAIMLLRYRTETPTVKSVKYCTYKTIT